MSLSEIYNRAWGDEGEFVKLSEADQEGFGRIAARGFIEKLSELSGYGEDIEKEAASVGSASKKAKLIKALAKAGLIGGGAGAAGAIGHSIGRKKERTENVRAVRSYLQYLRARGHLR